MHTGRLHYRGPHPALQYYIQNFSFFIQRALGPQRPPTTEIGPFLSILASGRGAPVMGPAMRCLIPRTQAVDVTVFRRGAACARLEALRCLHRG